VKLGLPSFVPQIAAGTHFIASDVAGHARQLGAA